MRRSFSPDSFVRGPHPLAPRSLHVYTRGALLTSGFAYHPRLFDLNIHPIMWDKFTSQIVATARLSPAERARVWAVGTAAAMTTSFPESCHIGQNKSRRIQESKVREGLQNGSEDSLGDLLHQWNAGYFSERGLLARLDLNEAAQNSSPQQSKAMRRGSHWYAHKEDRELVRAERKFSIVITQIHHGEGLADSVQTSCSSGNTSPSSDQKSSIEVTGFKPLPELPTGAHPLIDVMNYWTNFDKPNRHPDALPTANQFAELEGDSHRILLNDQAIVPEDPFIGPLPLEEYSEFISQLYSQVAGQQSTAATQPASKLQPIVDESQVVADNHPLPLTQSTMSEQEAMGNWPLPRDLPPNGNLLAQAEMAKACTAEPVAAHSEMTPKHRTAQPVQYRLYPNMSPTERSVRSIRTTGSTLEVAPTVQSTAIPRDIEEPRSKAMASPTASFFLPLDMKGVSTTLDFDPQLATKDMATAH